MFVPFSVVVMFTYLEYNIVFFCKTSSALSHKKTTIYHDKKNGNVRPRAR